MFLIFFVLLFCLFTHYKGIGAQIGALGIHIGGAQPTVRQGKLTASLHLYDRSAETVRTLDCDPGGHGELCLTGNGDGSAYQDGRAVGCQGFGFLKAGNRRILGGAVPALLTAAAYIDSF